MADPHRTRLDGSPERKHRETESYFTTQTTGSASQPVALRPGFERQTSAPFRAQLSTIRSPNSPGPVTPGAPRTPIFNRSVSSPFASPRADFSAGDESLVLEFGSRYLRIGLGGEKRPRYTANFGPHTQRRAGDYAKWLHHNAANISVSQMTQEEWGIDHELWQMDLRGLDLCLVKDKVERAVRDAMTQHVLILDDMRKRSHIIAVPSRIPQPLLTVVLEALFAHSPSPPSVSLTTTPVLNVVSAGLRSGLVIDIGWRSTTMTAVYEYREIKHTESSCAMKAVHWELASLLKRYLDDEATSTESVETQAKTTNVSFEDSENILYRLVWCRPPPSNKDNAPTFTPSDRILSIPLTSLSAKRNLQVPVLALSQPVEHGLFATHIPDPDRTLDDNDLPLPRLAYRLLLSLPPDVRGRLLPRIVITGGGANIPGVKARLLSDIAKVIKDKEWDPVHNYGSVEAKIKLRKNTLKTPGPVPVASTLQEAENTVANRDIDPATTTPAYLQPPLPDPVVESIQSRVTSASDLTHRAVRGVETLGAWAGASLMAGLRVKGAVEIERERFLQHGLLGAGEREEDSKHKRQSIMPGQGPQAKSGDRHSGNWTLGAFG